MGVKVTVYNDDPHGRDIQVVHLNPYGASVKGITVQKSEGDSTSPTQYEIKNGELLIISTAEKE